MRLSSQIQQCLNPGQVAALAAALEGSKRITAEVREFAAQIMPVGILAQRPVRAAKANTGELNVKAAKRAGANGGIAGHSEARANFGDTDADVADQLLVMHEEELHDKIFAFGET